MGVVQMGVVQLGLVQMGVVQLGVVQVQLGLVQLGVVQLRVDHTLCSQGCGSLASFLLFYHQVFLTATANYANNHLIQKKLLY